MAKTRQLIVVSNILFILIVICYSKFLKKYLHFTVEVINNHGLSKLLENRSQTWWFSVDCILQKDHLCMNYLKKNKNVSFRHKLRLSLEHLLRSETQITHQFRDNKSVECFCCCLSRNQRHRN